jgi:hypothetical protein
LRSAIGDFVEKERKWRALAAKLDVNTITLEERKA